MPENRLQSADVRNATPAERKTIVGSALQSNADLAGSTVRIKSRDLLREAREIEIDHEGRIYRLRVTQLNKLILTA